MSGKSKQDKEAFGGYLPPRVAVKRRRMRLETASFTGVSMNGQGDSTVAEGKNLSARCYPALATRRSRKAFCYHAGKGTPHGMIHFGDALYVAYGTGLYRTVNGMDVTLVATVSDTDKQFFVFGDRLYIYPDKLYVERDGLSPRPIEIDAGVQEQVEFQKNTITLSPGVTWHGLGFEAGDCLRVLIGDDVNPIPEGYYYIKAVQGRVATVDFSFATLYEGDARCLRVVPTLERYCVSGNRVYGFLGTDVYISREGSATDWYSRDTDGTGPVLMHTAGEMTACIPWQGYVVFFRSDRILKLLGSRSDTFTLQDSGGVGLPKRLTETLCEVNGELYYHGESGVYRYRGQSSELVCATGETVVTGGCGGSDGLSYFLSIQRQDEDSRLYVYSPHRGIWSVEDGVSAAFMRQSGGFVRIQAADGYVWISASDGRMGAGHIDERMVYGELSASATLHTDHAPNPEGFRLTAIYLRATGSMGGSLSVLASYGDGRMSVDTQPGEGEILGVFAGGIRDRLLRVPVIPRLCDSMSLTLLMKGEWIIHSVMREYEEIEV